MSIIMRKYTNFNPFTTNSIAYLSTSKIKHKVVMIRHGQSEWNEKDLFCGWFDANLTEKGKQEAKTAANSIKKANIKFDTAFTSCLKRAQDTLDIILKEIDQTDIRVIKSWRLNERHYGALTGLNKSATTKKFGVSQVAKWRRSFDEKPPKMEPNHPNYNDIVKDPKYANDLKLNEFPMAESLKLTIERTMPFWNDNIAPDIKAGKSVIIVSHGNALRGIVKHLDDINNEDIMLLDIPTGVPFTYTLDENLRPLPNSSMLYIGA